jgi:hypothetical protein
MITDLTYFINDLHLAQKGQLAVGLKITQYIDQFEPEYLTLMLGSQMYAEFNNGLIAPTPDQKWIDLRDGADFVNSHGITVHWPGFNKKGQSPIAAYVYYKYVRSEARFLVGSGAITPNVENARRVDVIPLQVNAWNSMIDLNLLLFSFLRANSMTYPTWGNYNTSLYLDNYHCDSSISPVSNLLTKINQFNL